MKYILASKSPRRKEILQNLGLSFEVVTADTDESSDISEPALLVEELSLRKGRAVYDKLIKENAVSNDDVIISSDTLVVYENNILGKPTDRADAVRMLRLLSGKRHKVISGVAIIHGGREFVSHSETSVYFDDLSDAEIDAYIATGEPFDKAGAYGIQGTASLWVNRIDGCYFGVVGLPINTLNKLHTEATGRSLL